jgi:hypothetical protein
MSAQTDDNLGDWRIDGVSTVAEDVGDIKKGMAIRLMSAGKHRKHKYLSFVTPSVPAMCLDIAIDASARAEALRPKIQVTELRTHDGKRGLQVRDEHISDLYYFFEQAIVTATMSFQTLEAFANAVIGRRAHGIIEVKRRAGVVDQHNPEEAERNLSTEDKFAQVLPGIFGVDSPKGGKTWNRFKELKSVRDKTVHIKSQSMYTRFKEGESTLLFDFLAADIRTYPCDAVKILDYYHPSDGPRWLRYARDKVRQVTMSSITIETTL